MIDDMCVCDADLSISIGAVFEEIDHVFNDDISRAAVGSVKPEWAMAIFQFYYRCIKR